MPYTRPPDELLIPTLEQSLNSYTVEDLKWCAAVVADKLPTRKGDLIALMVKALSDAAEVQKLWSRLTRLQQQVVAEVVHRLGNRYKAEILEAKYPGAAAPVSTRGYGSYYFFFGSGTQKKQATPYDILFFPSYDSGFFIPSDVAALLRGIAPPPPPTQLHSHAELSEIMPSKRRGHQPQVMTSAAERTVLDDLVTTLYLIKQGKIGVSASSRLPSLSSVRQLRQRLLAGDYFGGQEYDRAEDAIRPLALTLLVQAARWAAPAGSGGKLELTKAGQALLDGRVEPQHVREAWNRWIKTDLLDELSRIRSIRGQQSKAARLTKPAERREKLVSMLRVCPVDRWIAIDEFFRYIRAEDQSPLIERNSPPALYIGSYSEYGWEYSGASYWNIVVGSYLRAVLWEYAATLGLIEIAYTLPEELPLDLGDSYVLNELDFISRYDGLVGFRLTSLGAYVLGLSDRYEPPAAQEQTAPMIKVLPNLDVVITDAQRATLQDRIFLERIGVAQSQDVYQLSREQILDATEQGVDLAQITAFLAARSGVTEDALPQTVRVFLADVAQRVGVLLESGRMLLFESDDPYVLAELANKSELRAVVRLATIDERTVLLVPEDRETAVRRQFRKLGYVPRKRS
jgi:hypothetical protein